MTRYITTPAGERVCAVSQASWLNYTCKESVRFSPWVSNGTPLGAVRTYNSSDLACHRQHSVLPVPYAIHNVSHHMIGGFVRATYEFDHIVDRYAIELSAHVHPESISQY